jgi:hypothetical protein
MPRGLPLPEMPQAQRRAIDPLARLALNYEFDQRVGW